MKCWFVLLLVSSVWAFESFNPFKQFEYLGFRVRSVETNEYLMAHFPNQGIEKTTVFQVYKAKDDYFCFILLPHPLQNDGPKKYEDYMCEKVKNLIFSSFNEFKGKLKFKEKSNGVYLYENDYLLTGLHSLSINKRKSPEEILVVTKEPIGTIYYEFKYNSQNPKKLERVDSRRYEGVVVLESSLEYIYDKKQGKEVLSQMVYNDVNTVRNTKERRELKRKLGTKLEFINYQFDQAVLWPAIIKAKSLK